MSKFRIQPKGFIITFLDTNSGNKIAMYAELASWGDAIDYATKMLSLNCYKNCDLYQITRNVSCLTKENGYYGRNL